MVEEIDRTFEKMTSSSDVIGGLVIDEDGTVIKSSLDNKISEIYAEGISDLISRARKLFREMDSNEDVMFLRLSTKKFNVMIAPDKRFLLILLTNLDSHH